MKAFILAAGLGTRLRPLTEKQPKVMVEVGGKKILERTIEQLRSAGVDEFIINTHYFPQVVPNYFGDGSKWGVKIVYSNERDILGTAGGLKKVEDRLKEEKEFLVIHGDTVFDLDFSPFIAQPLKAPCLMMVFDRDKSPNSGAVPGVVDINPASMVTGYYEAGERPEIPYVLGGAYKCSPKIFEFIPPAQFFDFGKQVFPDMLKQKEQLQAYVIRHDEGLFSIENMDCLDKAEKYFKSQIRS